VFTCTRPWLREPFPRTASCLNSQRVANPGARRHPHPPVPLARGHPPSIAPAQLCSFVALLFTPAFCPFVIRHSSFAPKERRPVATPTNGRSSYNFSKRLAPFSLSAFCDSKMGRGTGRAAALSYFAFNHSVPLSRIKPRTLFRCTPMARCYINFRAFRGNRG